MIKSSPYSEYEILFLSNNYPDKGKMYCVEALGRTESSVRYKASELGLKINNNSEFFIDFQKRAAISKVGKKRPEQSLVMKKLHKDGKLVKTKEQRLAVGIRVKNYIENNGHPRGMLGKTHTDEVKLLISKHSKEMQKSFSKERKKEIKEKMIETKIINGTYMNSTKSSNAYSRTKSGKREDLGGRFFRSGTEANFARYLHYIKLPFEFETKEFFFEEIKRGSRFYLCDFYIPSKDIYYEVKGWLDSKSITKFKRMKKYYPIDFKKLFIVKQSLSKKDYASLIKIGFSPQQIIDFKDIEKLKGIIPNWE